jgi:hypothetical protein
LNIIRDMRETRTHKSSDVIVKQETNLKLEWTLISAVVTTMNEQQQLDDQNGGFVVVKYSLPVAYHKSVTIGLIFQLRLIREN